MLSVGFWRQHRAERLTVQPHDALRIAHRRKQFLRLSDVASASGASANECNLLPDMPAALCNMLIGLRQVQQLDIEIRHDRLTQLAMGF